MTENVQFSKSHSHVQAVSLYDIAASLEERMNNAVSLQHLPGTASMGFSIYSGKKTIAAAKMENNKLRVATSYFGIAALTATMFSKRDSAYPEAKTFKERVIKAGLHPDLYAMHAFFIYGFIPTLVSRLDHLYHGIKNPKEEFPRIISGVVGMAYLGLVWQSMFGNEKGIGQQEGVIKEKSAENMWQFMLQDKKGFIGRLLPPILGLAQWAEGEVKIRHGRKSGENFRLSGIINVINDLVTLGYTYNLMWQKEKGKQGNKKWAQEVLNKQEKKKDALSTAER